MNLHAEKILERLNKNKTSEINLSSQKLYKVSPLLQEFRNLNILNLFNNRLTEIPKFFSELSKLSNLNIGSNNFRILPQEITYCPLKSLSIANNQLLDIDGIENFSETLVKLDLSSNKLDNLNTDFRAFSSLRNVNLSSNELNKFPRSLILSNLKTLNLSSNNISIIPAEIEKFESLVELDLSYNNITELPEEIGKLVNLKKLNLIGNSIGSLPKSLGNLKKLQELNITGNPIGEVPIDIGKHGVRSVLNYYLHLGDYVRLNEAKLLVVGQGNVGKTFLLNKMIRDKTPEEGSTKGIDIMKWIIKDKEDNPIRLNAWDFGGQEIYHSTHQFFLTKRSIYILVWEARKDEAHIHFDYWLNIINTLSNSSPVILIMNKSDERTFEIDEKTIKETFPNVLGFHKTSALSGKGIPELIEEIEKNVLEMPHIGDKLPRKWLDIRNELESKSENYISYREYSEICALHGLERQEAKTLSQYFHDLGVYLHFDDNNTLKPYLFLNPKWVTNNVYKILDLVDVALNFGVFTLDLLEEKLENFDAHDISLIIELMMKFELCFKLQTNKYIIPELLRPSAPIEVPEISFSDGIGMRYKYDFMPAGIVTRLTVRLKEHIYDQLYWRNGVYFKHNDTIGLVENNPYNREISILVIGENQALLLGIIKAELDIINQSLNNPSHKIDIKCSCNNCRKSSHPFMFSFDYLNRAKTKFDFVTCEHSLEEVSLSKLIGPYEILYTRRQSEFRFNETDLLYDIMEISNRLMERKYTVELEDLVNDQFVDFLRTMGYQVYDQTRSGRSRKGSGELDFMIRDSKGLPISIVEALRIDSFGPGNRTILEHLTKLINDYDATGLPTNFLLVYSESKDFSEAWIKYEKYISNLPHHFLYNPSQVELVDMKVMKELNRKNNIKVLVTNHSKDLTNPKKVYHIFMNLNNSKD